MVADVSTLLMVVTVVSVVLAGALAVAAWGGRRDGLRYWSAALGLNALACGLVLWRAHLPDGWATVLGAALVSAVMAAVLAAISRYQDLPLPWGGMVLPPLLLALLLVPMHGDLGGAATLVGSLLAGQTAWVVWTLLERRLAFPERGAVLVAVGLGGLMMVYTALAIAGLAGMPDPQSLLADPAMLALGILLTMAAWLVATVGFVLMQGNRGYARSKMLAALDEVTGIANRRSIIAALDRDVARAIRTRLPIALMMVELDPVAGSKADADQALRSMVEMVQNRIRSQDIVGRYGVSELLVVLPDTTVQGATRLAEQLCEAAQSLQPANEGVAGVATVSVGVFGGRLEPGDSWDLLIHAADHALARARQSGSNRVESTALLGRPVRVGGVETSPETFPASLH